MGERVEQFPLGLCVATLVVTGLGLWAALAGVQWGAVEPRGDALTFGFYYVNLALGAVWFLVWPAAIYRRGVVGDVILNRLRLQLPTILVAAIPAMCIAGWVSMMPWGEVERTIGLQLGFALFAFGALAWGRRNAYWQIFIVSMLAVLYLVMPAVAYLQLEFLPAISAQWLLAIPALALSGYDASDTWNWGIAVTYAAVGVLLAALPRHR